MILAFASGISIGACGSKLFEDKDATGDQTRLELKIWMVVNASVCTCTAALIYLFVRRDKNRFRQQKPATMLDSTGGRSSGLDSSIGSRSRLNSSSSSRHSRSSSAISTGSTSSQEHRFYSVS